MKSIAKVLISSYGQIAVFDEDGEQIPELQVSLISMWTERAKNLGFEPDKILCEFVGHPCPFVRIFKTENGYNWERA